MKREVIPKNIMGRKGHVLGDFISSLRQTVIYLYTGVYLVCFDGKDVIEVGRKR